MKDWATLLQEINISDPCDVVPKGWKSITQIAKESNLPVRTARDKCNSLLGTCLDRRKFRIQKKDGTRHTVYHYKFK